MDVAGAGFDKKFEFFHEIVLLDGDYYMLVRKIEKVNICYFPFGKNK